MTNEPKNKLRSDFPFRAPPLQEEGVKAPRFVGLSVLLHAAGVAALLFVSATAVDSSKMETVTVELAEVSGPESIPDGASVPISEGETASAPLPALTPVEETVKAEDIVVEKPVAKAPPAAAPKAETSVVKTAPVVKAASLPVAPVEKSAPVVKTTPAVKSENLVPAVAKVDASPAPEVEEHLEDIEAPELAEPIATVVPFKEKQVPAVAREDIQKAEAKAASALSDFENEIGKDSGDFADAEGALNEAESRNAAEAAAVAARVAALREQSAKAAAAAASEAGKKQGGSGQGSEGKGGNEAGAAAAGTAGVPGGVRSLEQIRQMPGNPKPRYSENERFEKRQGEVVYLAYVNKSGQPVQFKQTHTTGHQSLDEKTLAALKQWKFYPGQEGWVEIPFRWDLRGGPQEMSALSRRKFSQKVD